MPSYFKTQGWRLFVSLVCLIYAFVIAFTSTAVIDSVEGLGLFIGDLVRVLMWFAASCTWAIMSFINYHEDCIKELNKRLSKLENRAITDIEELSDNHFVCKRKLGPDKEEN